MRLHGGADGPAYVQIVNNRWEVAVTVSDGQFSQVSFVNSICTYKGGTHVTYIADQVVRGKAPPLAEASK